MGAAALRPLSTFATQESQETQDVALHVEDRRTTKVPVDVHRNLPTLAEAQQPEIGDKHIETLAPGGTLRTFPEGKHIVDVQSVGEENELPQFRVIRHGVESPLQASPAVIEAGGSNPSVLVLTEPVLIKQPVLTLDPEDAEVDAPSSIRLVHETGQWNFPFAVDIRNESGEIVWTVTSVDGHIPSELPALQPGSYSLVCRPIRQHYPLTFSAALSAKEKSAKSGLSVNQFAIPVNVNPGQTLTVSIGEGIESYNQIWKKVLGTNAMVVANTPYLHMNNEPEKPLFVPTETEPHPNAALSVFRLGADQVAKDMARVITAGILEDRQKNFDPQSLPRNDYRVHHFTFYFCPSKDGALTEKMMTMSPDDMEREIAAACKEMIEGIMEKPHRYTDANGIHTIAGNHGFGTGQGPLHIDKDSVLELYGKQYDELDKKRREEKK